MLLANLSLTARRRVSHRLAVIFFALIVGVPIAWALFAVAGQALDSAALHALWQQPQARSALALSVWTALVSGVLAWLTAARLLAIGFVHQTLMRWMQHLPALLATPHAAMAIALVLWLSPSGWLLRLVSPTLTGFQSPPDWSTTQDPWGLGLILALWLKEVPFLLWIGATQLRRDDIRRRWQSEYGLAQTLGYPPSAAFARVVWPQLALTLRWPLLAVVAYGLGVVDMALILGPTTPPTFAVLSWQWLGDANVAQQAMGAVAAGVLTGCVALMAALIMYGRATRWLLVRGTMAVVQWPPLTTPVSLATSAHGVPPPLDCPREALCPLAWVMGCFARCLPAVMVCARGWQRVGSVAVSPCMASAVDDGRVATSWAQYGDLMEYLRACARIGHILYGVVHGVA